MAEPAGTAKEKILLASILGPLGAVPAPAQSRFVLAASGSRARAGTGVWPALCQHRQGNGHGQRAQRWAPGEHRPGWELDTDPQGTARFLGSQVGPWWVPVSLPKGRLLSKAQPHSQWFLAARMTCSGAMGSHPALPPLPVEHHGAPYSWRTGCQGTLQLLLPHRGERIPHAALG